MKRLAEAWFLLTTALLPLKFGGLAVMPEAAAYFPDAWQAYLIVGWPTPVFGIAAAVSLLLNLAARGFRLPPCRTPAALLAALWSFGFLLLALPGFLRAPGFDFAMLMIPHLAGIGAYVLAAWIAFAEGDAARGRWLGALTLGTLLAIAAGWEQYLWGFERARAFFREQEALGVVFPEAIRLRTFDDRVYGTFAGCNSLAGWLLLTLAPAALVLLRWGDRVEPVRWSKRLFLLLGIGGSAAILLLTRSRAAFLALALGAAAAIPFLPVKRIFRILLIAAIIAAAAGGAVYIRLRGRGFDSMAARADYLRTSLLLLADHPAAGCGWGGFYAGHMRLKRIASAEAAHDPHNLLMTAAQAGPAMLLAMAAAFLVPLWLLARRWRRGEGDRAETLAALAGLFLFFLHALMDIDALIPGLMAAAAGLTLWALPTEPETKPAPRRRAIPLVAFALFAGLTGYATLRGEMALDDLVTAVAERRPDIAIFRERANAWRPWSSYPWSIAADAMAARGDWIAADRWYAEAAELSPLRPDLCRRRAEARRRLGDWEAAAELEARARALFPRDPRYSAESR